MQSVPGTDEPQNIPQSVSDKHATFRVDRTKLVENNEYFRALLGGNWAESSGKRVTLNEDNAKAVEIWLRLFHANLSDLPYHSVCVDEVWQVIVVADKYGFDLKQLEQWYTKWCARKLLKIDTAIVNLCRQLLPLCFKFNDAAGLREVTKRLVYQCTDKIEELIPVGIHTVHGLHMPPQLIGKYIPPMLV